VYWRRLLAKQLTDRAVYVKVYIGGAAHTAMYSNYTIRYHIRTAHKRIHHFWVGDRGRAGYPKCRNTPKNSIRRITILHYLQTGNAFKLQLHSNFSDTKWYYCTCTNKKTKIQLGGVQWRTKTIFLEGHSFPLFILSSRTGTAVSPAAANWRGTGKRRRGSLPSHPSPPLPLEVGFYEIQQGLGSAVILCILALKSHGWWQQF